MKVFGDVIASIPYQESESEEYISNFGYMLFGDRPYIYCIISRLNCVFLGAIGMNLMVVASHSVQEIIPSECVTYRSNQTIMGNPLFQIDIERFIYSICKKPEIGRLLLEGKIKPIINLPGGVWDAKKWKLNRHV